MSTPTIPTFGKVYRFSQYGSLDNLSITQDPVAKPGVGEVLLKIHAVALNYREIAILRQTYPVPLSPSVIPGCDASGSIIALGPGCRRFALGERVMPNMLPTCLHGVTDEEGLENTFGGPRDGFLREYAVVPEECLVRVPEGWSWEEAATMPCAGVTAYNALMGLMRLKGGDTVLLQGTGGVSIFALQIAVASGATVILTSSSDTKLEIARKLGAHHLINYRTHPDWEVEVLKLTQNKGVDQIIEVGGPGTLTKSFKCIKFGGLISNIGFLDPGQGDPTNFTTLSMVRGVVFRGVLMGSREQFEKLCALCEARGIRPVVDRVFGFGEAREAYAHLESQKFVGKVIIRVQGWGSEEV